MKRMIMVLWFAVIVASSAAMAGTNNVDIVAAARKQIGVTVGYDPAYRRLAYPNGDVPRSSGVCTDVVIRALRDARKVDLQKLVHEDIVGGRLPHIMIVSDKKAADGTPLVIHNIGSGTKEEDCLFTYPLTGVHWQLRPDLRRYP